MSNETCCIRFVVEMKMKMMMMMNLAILCWRCLTSLAQNFSLFFNLAGGQAVGEFSRVHRSICFIKRGIRDITHYSLPITLPITHYFSLKGVYKEDKDLMKEVVRLSNKFYSINCGSINF